MTIIEILQRDYPDLWKQALAEAKGDKLEALVLLKRVTDAVRLLGLLK
jgi:hypothetical protein